MTILKELHFDDGGSDASLFDVAIGLRIGPAMVLKEMIDYYCCSERVAVTTEDSHLAIRAEGFRKSP